MRTFAHHLPLALLGLASAALAQAPATPKPLLVSDTALKVELLATTPEVEACTTVCADPTGAIYAGNDPRDGRLSTKEPACNIVRFSGTGPDRKRTVFADKIYSPAGSAWFDGWLYVIHDPFLTRFKDTDGDGVADVREDLVENLGVRIQDGGLNDHDASGFTLGMDGHWYISIGDRGSFETRSLKDHSEVSLLGGGIIRCRLDGTGLEIYSTGTRNHLEVNLDAEDNAFTRDNTDDGNGWWTRVTHHVRGGYYGYPYDYQKVAHYGVVVPSPQTLDAMKRNGHEGLNEKAGPPEIFLPAMADFGSGSPTGGLCYLSDGLPEAYRGKHFFAEWGKGGIFVTEVARDGATFKLVNDTELVQADKGGEFRPMQISLAPDGSMLISDWGYGGWKSPRVAGAIWRLSWPDAHPAPRLKDEQKSSVEELIAALAHPDRDQRLRAEYELIKRGDADVQALKTRDYSKATPQSFHSIWAWAQAADADPKSLADWRNSMVKLDENADEGIRVQILRALRTREPLESVDPKKVWEFDGYLLRAFCSDSPLLRREAAAAMGNLRSYRPEMGQVLVMGTTDSDPWVRAGARRSAIAYAKSPLRENSSSTYMAKADVWKTLLGQDVVDPAGLDFYVAEASLAASTLRPRAVAALGRIAYQPTPWDGKWWGTQPVKNPPPLSTVAWAGTPQALEALIAALGDQEAPVRLAAAKAFTVFALDAAGEKARAALRTRLTEEKDTNVRRQLVESIGTQKDPAATEVFTKIALDESAEPDFRETAIGAIVNIGGDAAKQTVAKLAGAALTPKATLQLIKAAGDLRVLEAAPALIAHLKDERTAQREASAKSLGQLGPKANATEALIAASADKDGKTAAAAVEALGNLRDKSALPALIALAEKRKYQKETIQAISNMADETAVPVLVEALREKNTAIRRNALKALKPFQAKARPLIDDMLAKGRVPQEIEPEIRNFFAGGAVTQWKMIGVFENVWEAVHEPEKDALANGGRPDLTKKYHNAEGQDAAWHDVSAEAGTGQADLGNIFKTSAMVCAYAYTEIDTPEAAEAKILGGADDELGIWLNGKSVLNRGGNHGFELDGNEVTVQLPAGKNALFVKIGNKGGTWVFNLRIPGFENGKFVKSKEATPEEKQRVYALAAKPDGSWEHKGDVERGAKLFSDPTGSLGGICATCHMVKGKGGVVGPDLSVIAANYKRPDLVTSILEPSKTIALGFEPVMFETKGGETIAGSLRSESGDAFSVVDATGQAHAVKKSDVKQRTDMHISLMPQGLTLALKPEEFVDLLSFLETLH